MTDTMRYAGTGVTRYGGKIDGDSGNYGWHVRFDANDDGYVGISQYDGQTLTDRVLLSPNQVRALVTFVGKRSAGRARSEEGDTNG